MNLVTAVRLSTGWIFGMVGTCTKLKYQSRPIHITPLMIWSQRMQNVAQEWLKWIVSPDVAATTAMMMIRTMTPAATVRPKEVNTAPILNFSPISLKGLAFLSRNHSKRGGSCDQRSQMNVYPPRADRA